MAESPTTMVNIHTTELSISSHGSEEDVYSASPSTEPHLSSATAAANGLTLVDPIPAVAAPAASASASAPAASTSSAPAAALALMSAGSLPHAIQQHPPTSSRQLLDSYGAPVSHDTLGASFSSMLAHTGAQHPSGHAGATDSNNYFGSPYSQQFDGSHYYLPPHLANDRSGYSTPNGPFSSPDSRYLNAPLRAQYQPPFFNAPPHNNNVFSPPQPHQALQHRLPLRRGYDRIFVMSSNGPIEMYSPAVDSIHYTPSYAPVSTPHIQTISGGFIPEHHIAQPTRTSPSIGVSGPHIAPLTRTGVHPHIGGHSTNLYSEDITSSHAPPQMSLSSHSMFFPFPSTTTSPSLQAANAAALDSSRSILSVGEEFARLPPQHLGQVTAAATAAMRLGPAPEPNLGTDAPTTAPPHATLPAQIDGSTFPIISHASGPQWMPAAAAAAVAHADAPPQPPPPPAPVPDWPHRDVHSPLQHPPVPVSAPHVDNAAPAVVPAHNHEHDEKLDANANNDAAAMTAVEHAQQRINDCRKAMMHAIDSDAPEMTLTRLRRELAFYREELTYAREEELHATAMAARTSAQSVTHASSSVAASSRAATKRRK